MEFLPRRTVDEINPALTEVKLSHNIVGGHSLVNEGIPYFHSTCHSVATLFLFLEVMVVKFPQ